MKALREGVVYVCLTPTATVGVVWHMSGCGEAPLSPARLVWEETDDCLTGRASTSLGLTVTLS